jgi:CDP-2,3-bis-(O-geranylgeranyl)-sn-glycerol synthase
MFKFILECLYFLAPAGFAILVPDIFGHFDWIPKLDIPVDLNKTFRGRRITGDHKTVRGFIVGTLAAVVAAYVQHKLYSVGVFKNHSIFDYSNLVNSLLLGGLMGFGALVGDSVKSIFKRQLDIKPGGSLFFFDQIDFILGAYIFVLPLIVLPFRYLAGMMTIYFIIHLVTTGIGYLVGVKETWI